MYLTNRVFLLFTIIILGSACVTKKKKGEVSALGKFYHNTTSHYNSYFNANELIYLCEQRLIQAYKPNYNKILPIYPETELESVDNVKADLDKSIEKVSIAITLHRVAKWTDDCYFLLGKSQFYKKDYEAAQLTFEYALEEFNPSKISAKEKLKNSKQLAKEKKEAKEKAAKDKKKAQAKSKSKSKSKTAPKKTTNKENQVAVSKNEQANEQKSGWFRHTPRYWETSLWLAKTYTKRKMFFQSESMLRDLLKDNRLPKQVKEDIYPAYADVFLSQQKYVQAIPYLEKAISLSGNKQDKARYNFILGQLYSRDAKPAIANDYYAACIKAKPVYDMVFHAKLGILLNKSKLETAASSDEIIADLNKMIKDGKNADYLAEIHYTIAKIQLKDNKRAEAITSLNTAIQQAGNNPEFKAESFKLLAELHFEDQDYQKAKYYYDSTLTFFPKGDPRRAEVNKLASNLSEIANALEIIQKNQELLRLSELSTKEKREYALKKKEEQKLKQEATQSQVINKSLLRNLAADEFNPFIQERQAYLQKEENAKSKPSTFFAYNMRSLNRGRSEFEQVWGNRISEDNWRRSDKTSVVVYNNEEQRKEEIQSEEQLEEDLAAFLKDVPNTPEEKSAIEKQIEEAMFNLGVAYREKIENYAKSNEILIALLDKYPLTSRKVDDLYYQYLNYLDLGNSPKAESTKDAILYEFPGSNYARILKDPNYAKSISKKKNAIEEQYETAYQAFSTGSYQQAFEISSNLKSSVSAPNPYLARIGLLNVLCIGNLQGRDAYINALRDFVANYPNTKEEIHAKEILRFLKGDNEAFIEINTKSEDKANFLNEDDKQHYVIAVFFNPVGKQMNEVKLSISDFNGKYYKLDNLKMSTIELDDASNPTTLLLIRKFENKIKAMRYYESATSKNLEYIPNYTNYEVFAVSVNNYKELLRLNSIAEYRKYFADQYAKK